MKKITKNIITLILILGIMVLLWFFMNNIRSIKSMLVVLFVVFVWTFVKLFFPNFPKTISQKSTKLLGYSYFPVIFIVSIFVIGVFLRFLIYFLYSYSPISDPGSFYNQAQLVASGVGLVGDRYVAFFPYLGAYINALGVVIKMIPNPWLATIILNTVFDLLASLIAMQLIKIVSSKTSKKYLVAFALWFLSPFNLIFSLLSLPIIIVNFFIVLSVFLVFMLFQKIVSEETTSSLILSIIIGLVMGYGNCFRPIFPIALVAVFLYLTYLLLTSKLTNRIAISVISCFLIITSLFFAIQSLNVAFVSRQTGFNVSPNSGGWSIYVGSNTIATGSWNPEDDKYLYSILENNSDFEQVHERLTSEGIERYKNLGLLGSVSLMFRKLSLFAGSQGSVYDAEASIIGYQDSMIELIFSFYIIFYIYFIFASSIRCLWLSSKSVINGNKINSIVIFVTILMIGLFLSDAFVEAQLRYAQVMYPLFIILATLGLTLCQNTKIAKLKS